MRDPARDKWRDPVSQPQGKTGWGRGSAQTSRLSPPPRLRDLSRHPERPGCGLYLRRRLIADGGAARGGLHATQKRGQDRTRHPRASRPGPSPRAARPAPPGALRTGTRALGPAVDKGRPAGGGQGESAHPAARVLPTGSGAAQGGGSAGDRAAAHARPDLSRAPPSTATAHGRAARRLRAARAQARPPGGRGSREGAPTLRCDSFRAGRPRLGPAPTPGDPPRASPDPESGSWCTAAS